MYEDCVPWVIRAISRTSNYADELVVKGSPEKGPFDQVQNDFGGFLDVVLLEHFVSFPSEVLVHENRVLALLVEKFHLKEEFLHSVQNFVLPRVGFYF